MPLETVHDQYTLTVQTKMLRNQLKFSLCKGTLGTGQYSASVSSPCPGSLAFKIDQPTVAVKLYRTWLANKLQLPTMTVFWRGRVVQQLLSEYNRNTN